MAWGMIGGAAVSVIGGSLMNSGSSGGGGGSTPSGYIPTNQGGVDTSWQNLFNQQGSLSNTGVQGAQSGIDQSLQQGQAVNYQPYLQGAQNAGNVYGNMAAMGQDQATQYGYQGQTALAQQQQMYGAGNQVMQTAFDPQNALYDKTQQQVQDQTRAGQAARGLGNSAEGSMEEANAMSNFNVNWQNNQLQRQAQGVSSGVAANQAGVQQGNLYGQNQQAALGAVGQAATAYGQQGQVPMQAQQYAAAQPGQVSQQYMQGVGQQQALNTNAMNGAQSYMGLGQSAAQNNLASQTANNQSTANLLGQIGTAGINYFNSQPPAVSQGSNANGYYGTQNNPSAYVPTY